MAKPPGSRRTARRRLIWFGVPALLVACVACTVLDIAASRGAFESRMAYWLDRSRDCARVSYGTDHALDDPSDTAPAVVSCFATAYARCEPPTLTRGVGGFDTSQQDTFVVEPRDAGGCDVELRRKVSFMDRATEVQCAAVGWDRTLLTFAGCGSFDDIVVPAQTASIQAF